MLGNARFIVATVISHMCFDTAFSNLTPCISQKDCIGSWITAAQTSLDQAFPASEYLTLPPTQLFDTAWYKHAGKAGDTVFCVQGSSGCCKVRACRSPWCCMTLRLLHLRTDSALRALKFCRFPAAVVLLLQAALKSGGTWPPLKPKAWLHWPLSITYNILSRNPQRCIPHWAHLCLLQYDRKQSTFSERMELISCSFRSLLRNSYYRYYLTTESSTSTLWASFGWDEQVLVEIRKP